MTHFSWIIGTRICTNRTKIKCLLTNVCFWLLVALAFLENISTIGAY